MTTTIKMTLGEARAKIPDLADRMTDAAYQALVNRAEFMRDMAKALVPVNRGFLRDSIRVETVASTGEKRTVHVIAGNSAVKYARYVEAKQPFMQPAFNLIREDLKAVLENAVAEETQK
jgi:HK97 gp10 family phage protein